ncbi:hypothetical protein Q2T42_20170 [Leptolyngbya boryana CZ1]|uniref:Uncharacterized protein n=1 Tax=Leptolyngbya boryana CZ1 TaxID=3060204 RepID=A0AA96WRJ6_LEPBY|nr:hypothetical protein [Leptolyngbya boryana]WNZ44148.1 hypothetical protein Q2T42_20170 [Leptolyngbya boryana CZ1]
MSPNLIENYNLSDYQTVKLGHAILSVPRGMDLKPYIRQLLSIELESIQNPVARASIAQGLKEATTDEDFSSLLETFHLLSSPANADRLIAALERSKLQETQSQSVEDLRREFGLVEETK